MEEIEQFLGSLGLGITDRVTFLRTLHELSKDQMLKMLLRSKGIDVKAILEKASA